MDFYEEDDDIIRSSRSQMFFKIGVLKNSAILTGKRLCWSLFLIKVQASGSYTGVFLWIMWIFWEHLFLQNTSGGCFFIVLLLLAA